MVHWPGDPPVRIRRSRDMEQGDEATVSAISMGSHTGTHMDAPAHFIRGGRPIDRLPLEAVIGPARVIAIRDRRLIRPEELCLHRIRRGERILLKTLNSTRGWGSRTFFKDFVALSLGGAKWLAKRGVQVVGVDYLSVGGYLDDGASIHRALLSAGIWIVEGLNLSRVRAGRYQFLCLPLRMEQGDGAPARAAIRPLGR